MPLDDLGKHAQKHDGYPECLQQDIDSKEFVF